MLVPLLAAGGGPDGQIQGMKIAMALLQAIVKTGVAIAVILAAGRVVLRPVYRRIADLGARPFQRSHIRSHMVPSGPTRSHSVPPPTLIAGNTDIFTATTLLVALGTSHLTGVLGLSEALGAFLAGLLLAETEYHLQARTPPLFHPFERTP